MKSFYLSTPYEPPTPPYPLPIKATWALLGGISPKQFMRQYWHKKPLLVRGAIPAFALAKAAGQPLESPISAADLALLAGHPDSESRLIQSKPWKMARGPFTRKSIPAISQANWTLLLQGADTLHPAAKTVLSWFRFIPDVRLDDLMISIAGPGGGVGPHVDSYDVFLIQMSGRRHWKISTQKDLSLKSNLPLKILAQFEPSQDWVLEPGDMLYLPPHVAHEGISLDAGCQTWSVGFRAASYRELIQEGLWRLAESLDALPLLDKRYQDPQQTATDQPDILPPELLKQLRTHLKGMKLDSIDTMLPGIASYLSEPKPHAFFSCPDQPLSAKAFAQYLKQNPLGLHPHTRLMRLNNAIFCNGENQTEGESLAVKLCWNVLSERHTLPPLGLENSDYLADIAAGNNSLYDAYCSGWLLITGNNEWSL
jgi:50S ribosomal protein L16 3-hydroxylase